MAKNKRRVNLNRKTWRHKILWYIFLFSGLATISRWRCLIHTIRAPASRDRAHEQHRYPQPAGTETRMSYKETSGTHHTVHLRPSRLYHCRPCRPDTVSTFLFLIKTEGLCCTQNQGCYGPAWPINIISHWHRVPLFTLNANKSCAFRQRL